MRGFLIALLLISALFLPLSCGTHSELALRIGDNRLLTAPVNSVSLANPGHFSFVAVGDLHISGGNTDRLRRILAAAEAEGDAFAFFLGDIVDTGREDDVFAFRKALTDLGWEGRAFTAIGNHDIFEDGWNHYRAYNGPSNYGVTIGNSRFLVLDTADGNVGEDQYAWLRSELAHPLSAHTFFVSHYLPRIPGQSSYLKLANDREAGKLMKLAVSHQVEAWLGAHYHSYILDNIDGLNILVAGGGGGWKRMEPVKEFFFVQVTVNGDEVSYRMNQVD